MQADDELTVYTIGHSNHPLDAFLDLLRRHGATLLVDVRSQPYSRWVPTYNREQLTRQLQAGTGMGYRFMGQVLGGRPEDRALYDDPDANGRPDYARVAASPAFQEGIAALVALARDQTLALMCSEGDYRECHRALLLTPSLLALGVRVMHILPDGETVEARIEPKQLTLF